MTTMTLDHAGTQLRTRPTRHLHAVPAPRDTVRTRLTRRGQTVVLFVAAALITLMAVLLGSSSFASSDGAAVPESTSVKVMPGHTLWEIAAEANPNGDIRQTVDDIVRLNSLPNASALQMGSTIAVPVY